MRRALSTRSSPEPAEVLRQVKEQVADVASQVRQGAVSAKDEVKDQVSDVVTAIADSLQEQAERVFDQQRDNVAATATRLRKAVHQAAHALHAVRMDAVADYVDTAADQMERMADYVKGRELSEVLHDAGEVIDRNRGLAIGGLFVAGFVAARFLKASQEPGDDDAANRSRTRRKSARGAAGGKGRPGRRRDR